MEYLWSTIFSLIFSFILLQFLLPYTKWSKPKTLPPGPTPLPVIGNLHILGQKPHQSLTKLAQIYGPIMSLKLGRITTVVISSSAAAAEVLQKQDLAFSSRSVPDALRVHNLHQYSVSCLPVGTRWRSLRKITATVLFSRNRLDANQHLRSTKVKDLIDYCRRRSNSGDSVDIGRAAFLASLNLMSNTLFSKELTDPDIDFKQVVRNIMVEAGNPNLADFFPALKMFDPQGVRRRMRVYFGMIKDMFGGLIDGRMELRKLHKSAAGNGDILDLCLDISEKDPEAIDAPHIRGLCMDLFLAGTDTTSSTVEWAMAELIRNPEILMQAKAELDQVIGRGNTLEEAYTSHLPYLNCIVKETLRLHPPLPFLFPRQLESDAELNGYIVPKGSQVLVNVWSIGRDPSLWDDSLTFKPERFLTLERDVRGLNFELIPFGAGRRICPGLPLGLRMVTVMLGSLINSFEWRLDGGIEPAELDMNEKFGFTLHKANPLLLVPQTFPQ